jgi:hypothetical protein
LATEARFRVQAPNSFPRTMKVIALDAAGQDVVRRLLPALGSMGQCLIAAPAGDELIDVQATRNLEDEIDGADMVVLIAGPGGHAHATSGIGEACSLRRVMTKGFVVGATSTSDAEIAKTLEHLRPWSVMIVASDEYIDDMMTALRA